MKGMIFEMLLFFVIDLVIKIVRWVFFVKLLDLLILFIIFVFKMWVELIFLYIFNFNVVLIEINLRWRIILGWLEIFCGCIINLLWYFLKLENICCIFFLESVIE